MKFCYSLNSTKQHQQTGYCLNSHGLNTWLKHSFSPQKGTNLDSDKIMLFYFFNSILSQTFANTWQNMKNVFNYMKNDQHLDWTLNGQRTIQHMEAKKNIYIYIYLTANGLSPGGSGYNACTWIWNKDLRNLSREGYMRSM